MALQTRTVYAGKRKTAVARVILTPGAGVFKVNDKAMTEYFTTVSERKKIERPFVLTNTAGQYDVSINVRGGGYSSQAEAVRHGVSKALITINPANRDVLKREGFLTRDSREKERKKPGQKGARKKFQFSKR